MSIASIVSASKGVPARAYINIDGEIKTFVKGHEPDGWKLIPKTLYVEWHDDQSCNSLIFGPAAMRADHSWDSTSDVNLTSEYADQLVDHLFN